MLRRDEHALDLDRPLAAVLVELVADGDLRLAVGPQVREDVGLPHLGEPPREPVREHDRQRHQLVGLVRGVAEHHPLVAGARHGPAGRSRRAASRTSGRRPARCRATARRSRRRRRTSRRRSRTSRACSRSRGSVSRTRLRDVDVGVGRDLAGDDDEAGRDQRLAGDASVGIVAEDGVEDGVGDLVGHLVRMALGDRLGGEGE